MTAYGFIIDVDLIADPEYPPATNCNAAGVVGPRDIDPAVCSSLEAGCGRRFRLYDDDGELYYEGRYIGPGWDDPVAKRHTSPALPLLFGSHGPRFWSVERFRCAECWCYRDSLPGRRRNVGCLVTSACCREEVIV